MKHFTEQQVQDIVKLKFGGLVDDHMRTQYASNKLLGQIFGVSGSKIR